MICRHITHFDIPSFSFPYSTKFVCVSNSQIADNGSFKRASVFEVYDPAEDDKQFTYRDFSLSNVIALGNPSLLETVQMSETKSSGIENLSKFNNNVQQAIQKSQQASN